jgi:uncharacterized protein DUF3179
MKRVLLACLAVSLILVAYPLYVIRPFRPQGARELAAALVVSRFSPMLTVALALAAALAAITYWRAQSAMSRKILAASIAMLVCVLAVLARVNVFEAVMFHALPHPTFAAAKDVKIDSDDKLIVVKINGSARAYPIREMAYHHVVNDVVGGAALAATY